MSYLCNATDPNCESVCTQYALNPTEITCLMCESTLYEDFASAWTSGMCRNVLPDAYHTNGIDLAQRRANRVMEYMMGTDGSNLAVNGTDDLQNSLLEVCGGYNSSAPDACANYIQNILMNGYTYDEMSYNLGVANWLGCYLSPPPDELQAYSNLSGSVYPSTCSLNGVGGFPCYPMCHRVDSVQRYDGSQRICNCDSNVCVIDQVSINSKDSSGSVSILQFCPSCTYTNPCTCIISDENIESDSTLGYTVNQYCGEDSVCYDIENGSLVNVDCQTLGSKPNSPAVSVAIPIFVIVIGLLLFLIVMGVLLSGSGGKDKQENKDQTTFGGSNNTSKSKVTSSK